MNELTIYEDLLRLPGLKITQISPLNRRIDIYGEVDEGPQPCPNCGEPTAIVRQYTQREIRDLDMSGRQVWLHLEMKQYECNICNRYFTQRLSWADAGKSYTKRQAKFIFEMCEHQAYAQVGAIVDMHAKSVERLYLEHAAKSCEISKRLQQVRCLGIDELSNRKGKKDYCCVLTDLERGIHLDILPDRKKATLKAYFQRLGADWCTQIEVVSCDMWTPYIEVAEEFFPQANISIDRFHVVVPLNKCLDRLRRHLRKDYPDEEAFKYIKWKLFKREDRLKDKEQQLLEKAFEKSPALRQMHELRNDFHRIFDQHTEHWPALLELNQWIERVQASAKSEYWESFLNTLCNWKGYILNFVDTRITNAATEGLNNIIRHIKRISFGMHNFEHLRLRVLARTG
ncbi:MAG: ISL3 family transposase [Bacteroidota bacterium]